MTKTTLLLTALLPLLAQAASFTFDEVQPIPSLNIDSLYFGPVKVQVAGKYGKYTSEVRADDKNHSPAGWNFLTFTYTSEMTITCQKGYSLKNITFILLDDYSYFQNGYQLSYGSISPGAQSSVTFTTANNKTKKFYYQTWSANPGDEPCDSLWIKNGTGNVTGANYAYILGFIFDLDYDVNAAAAELTGQCVNATEMICDLQGRRLAVPIKGFNIINGRKVVLR